MKSIQRPVSHRSNSIEHRPSKPGVAGPSPAGRTTIYGLSSNPALPHSVAFRQKPSEPFPISVGRRVGRRFAWVSTWVECRPAASRRVRVLPRFPSALPGAHPGSGSSDRTARSTTHHPLVTTKSRPWRFSQRWATFARHHAHAVRVFADHRQKTGRNRRSPRARRVTILVAWTVTDGDGSQGRLS